MKYSHHIPLNIHDIPWLLVKCSIYQEISSNPQPPTFPTFDPPKDISPRSHHPPSPTPEDPGDRPNGAPSLRSPAVFPSCAPAECRAVRDPPRTALAPGNTRRGAGKKGGFFSLNIGETNKKSTKIVCQASKIEETTKKN